MGGCFFFAYPSTMTGAFKEPFFAVAQRALAMD
jgi:hypothetical protein